MSKLKQQTYGWLGVLLLVGLTTTLQAAPAVGTVVVYSNGTAERLLAIDGRVRVWEDLRQRRITRDSNPVVPALQRDHRMTGSTDYRLLVRNGDPDAVLKSPPGRTVEFSYWRERRQGQRDLAPREYKCRYEGERQQKVLKQRLAVKRYSCERFVTHHKLWTQDVKESFIIDYSPQLEMPVEIVRIKQGKQRSQRLIAMMTAKDYSYRKLDKLLHPKKTKRAGQ